MRKIAITGIMGAGKSTVGSILQSQEVDFISADALVRQVLRPKNPGYTKLLNLLGPKYLDNENNFDTKKIAQKIFQDESYLQKVESLIHPMVLDLMRKKEEKLRFSGKMALFYEIPLLFEKKWGPFFDIKIVIAIDLKKQRKRLMNQRALTQTDIKNRMQFQMAQSEKIKRADHVVWNNSSKEELKKQVLSLLKLLQIQSVEHLL